ncbi:MAG: GDSL-type esterase/lipase family protein [Vicinamibacterales bacterium]
MKRLLKAVVKSLVTTVIVFAVAEGALRGAYFIRNSQVQVVPLPYTFGDDYGPIPPWLDRLMILKSDPTLIWSNTPNARRTYIDVFSPVRREQDRIALLRQFSTTLPEVFRANPTWAIQLNSKGYRGPDVAAAPPPATIRVACIGDSWTFGMNVNQDKTYPGRLAAWLQRERPDQPYEILNFGVLGYSSFQGLRQLKDHVLPMNPAIVAIGFAMNDSEVGGYRDKDVLVQAGPGSLMSRAAGVVTSAAEELEIYKLLKYEALVFRFRSKSTGDYLKAEANTKGPSPVNYDTIEPWTRVSPRDYEQNIREMIRLTQEKGAKAVLVDNELWNDSPYRPILRKLSSELGVPLVDSLALLEEARATIEQDIEKSLDLTDRSSPPPSLHPDLTTVVFRAFKGSQTVPKALSIVGTAAELGALTPNAVVMHDDGTGGDQKRGDGVWSYAAPFAAGTSLFYVYTNSGSPGVWEGLDVPAIRHVRVPTIKDDRPVYLPIETFGRVYMQADNWHTDAVGYDLIAQAVARAIAAIR